MKVNNIDNSQVSFGSYQSVLKTLFKKGKLPQVKVGLYNDPINVDNVSLEHLLPHSEGGSTLIGNLALASKKKNNDRGTRPLPEVLSWECLKKYLNQFRNILIPGKFDGNKYIEEIQETCEKLGVVNPKKKLKKTKIKRRKKMDFYA